jgi:HAD superfamily hydrolase (TIGR01509 family)
MIRCVIFDMDGLLVDSEPLWQKSEIKIFGDLGLNLTVDMCRQTMGMRIDEMVKYWFDKHPWDPKNKLETVANAIIEELKYNIEKEAKPLPGVYEVMDFLDTKQLPLAVASSSPAPVILSVLEKLSIKQKFKIINSAESEAYGKPHPGVYIRTANDLGIPPVESLVFEDSFNGLLSAKAARMKTVAVPESVSLSDPRFSIADVKLTSLLDFDEETWNKLNQ